MIVGQPKLLKEVNRDTIRDLIFEKGPVTRPELAKLTNLSLPTVNKIVDGLEADGVIRQDGLAGSSAGKKARLYVTNEKAGNIIALYFLDGAFHGCLVDATGRRIFEKKEEVDTSTGENALAGLCRLTDAILARSEAPVLALGIGVPGVVQSDKRITNISVIPGWNGWELENILCGRYQIPVFVENDVKLTTVGYYYAYLEDQCEDMVYLYIGKGIGSGIIIGGLLHRGFSRFAGEVGYLPPFEEEDGRSYMAGGGWLEDKMQEFRKNQEQSGCSRNYLHYIAVSMMNYIVTLNPEVMVLQGKSFNENTVAAIREDMKRFIPEESLPKLLINQDEECGINGLVNLCMANLSTTKQLVARHSI